MIKKIVVTRVSHPGLGRSAARNVEGFKTKADCVAFFDDDGVLEVGWASALQKKFDEGYSVVAGREVRLGKTVPRVPVFIGGQDISYPACCLAFKTEVFRRLGGFDERFDYAEDMDLLFRAVQAGETVGEAKDCIFYHFPRSSWWGFCKQSFWYGYGRALLEKKHGSVLKRTVFPKLSFLMGLRLFFGCLGYIYGKSRKSVGF